jgi:glycosyltransferase involved in cell wall biosynthesis
VGILAEYPMPIVYGGLEIVCERTYAALKHSKSCEVELVDYHNPEQNFDVLSVFGNPPSMYETIVFASKTKKVVISTVFGGAIKSRIASAAVKSFSWFAELFGQKIDHTRVRTMLRTAHHLAVLNEIERDFIAERYGIPFEKMTIVPVGVEDKHFTATQDLFIETYGIQDFILFTGNIIPRKNPLRLAQALKKAGLKGVFIGKSVSSDTAYSKEFEDYVESCSNLLWIKGLSASDPLLASAYRASTAFCLPSFAEGQSGSSLEAMAARKPIVLADLPYSYQSCYSTIQRCNPKDIDDIARAVSAVVDNPGKFISILPDVHRYSSIASQMADIYQKVVK